MSMISGLLMLAFILILTFVSAIFITRVWWKIRVHGNEDLKRANHFLFWGMIVSWVGLATLAAAAIFFMPELSAAAEAGQGGLFVNLFFWISILLILSQGILAALGANYIRESGQDKDLYNQTIIATAISLGAVVSLITFQLVKKANANERKKKLAEDKFNSAVVRAQLASMKQ